MSNKSGVQIDNSLVKQEEDVTRPLNGNQNGNLDEDEFDHIDKIFKKIKSYGRYQVGTIFSRVVEIIFII